MNTLSSYKDTVDIESESLGFGYANLCFLIYIFFVILNLMLPDVVGNSIIISVGGLIFLTQFRYITTYHRGLLMLVSFFLFMAMSLSFINGSESMVKALYLIPHLGLFAIVERKSNLNPKLIRAILYGWVFFVVYRVMIQGVDVNDILGYASRNMVSWFGLAFCFFYYILQFKKQRRPEYITAFLTLFLTILCQGRSSIFSASLFVLFLLYIHLKESNAFLRIFVLIVIPLSIIFIYNTFNDFFVEHFEYLENKKLESEGREIILQKYIQNLDFETVLGGIPGHQLYLLTFYSNYHNSFLQGHGIFGIFFLCFFLYLIYLMMRHPRENTLEKFLILILFIRGFTDPILFVGVFDFLLFFLFYNIYKRRELMALGGF